MNKKQALIFISAIILFLGCVFLLFNSDKKKKEKYLYLFSGDHKIVRWYYNDSKWYIMNQNTPLDKEFDVYSNGINRGKYSLVFNKRWYYFDDNNDSHDIDGVSFMINTNHEFKSYSFSAENIYDESIETQIYKKMGIEEDKYTINLKKYVINGNEDIKDLYAADFYKNQDQYSPLGPSYTIMFMINSNRIKIIDSMSFSVEDENSCTLGLVGLFNFESSDKILINCTHFDQIPSDYYLYDANNHNLLVASKGGL